LSGFASRIPGAPGRILLFAGISLRGSFSGEFGISRKVSQTLLQGTLKLVADTCDAICVDTAYAVSFGTGHSLGLAGGPLCRSIGRKLRIADDLAETFLQDSLDLVADAFEAIIVHDSLLWCFVQSTSSSGIAAHGP
jgi:hypothetical protein